MFSQEPSCNYKKGQLAEVICQLRFPEILMINNEAPAGFQEKIRSYFPFYSVSTDGQNNKNYQFVSQDREWRVNLTSAFISLSCAKYTSWSSFAAHLDMPVAALIQTYSPACFERIGLRYINFISRRELDVESYPFSDLIRTPYLGILSEEDVVETATTRCNVDVELSINRDSKVKIHAGPGMVKQNGQADAEVKFVFDQDIYTPAHTPINQVASVLEMLHSYAYPIFRDAITPFLHNAMEPEND